MADVFVYFFGGLQCVGHSFASVVHLWCLRDIQIRTKLFIPHNRCPVTSFRIDWFADWLRRYARNRPFLLEMKKMTCCIVKIDWWLIDRLITGDNRRMVKLPFATSDWLIWGNWPWSHFGWRTGFFLPHCVPQEGTLDKPSHSLIDPFTNSEARCYIGCVSGGRGIGPNLLP